MKKTEGISKKNLVLGENCLWKQRRQQFRIIVCSFTFFSILFIVLYIRLIGKPKFIVQDEHYNMSGLILYSYMESPVSPDFVIPSGLEGITSSDKAIGIRNVSKFPLSLNGSQIIVYRNTGDTVSFNFPVGIDLEANETIVLYRKMLNNENIPFVDAIRNFSALYEYNAIPLENSVVQYISGDDKVVLKVNGSEIDSLGLSDGTYWGKNLLTVRKLSPLSYGETPKSNRNGGGTSWNLVTRHDGTNDDWTMVTWENLPQYLFGHYT